MATGDIEKVLTFIRGIASRDSDLATRSVDPQKYTQHDPLDRPRLLPDGSRLRRFRRRQCIRHEPRVRGGVAAFTADLIKHRSVGQIKLVLGQGDFVFIAATGSQ